MPSGISGQDIDQRTVLSKIVRQWVQLNRKVAETWDGKDTPWWYGERASLSILAGAVWQLGGIAFEEYSEEKHRATRRGANRRSYSGRCDLFFQITGKEFLRKPNKHGRAARPTAIQQRASKNLSVLPGRQQVGFHPMANTDWPLSLPSPDSKATTAKTQIT